MATKQGSTVLTLLLTHLTPATHSLHNFAQKASSVCRGQLPLVLRQLQQKVGWPGSSEHPWGPSMGAHRHPWQSTLLHTQATCTARQLRGFASQAQPLASNGAAGQDGLTIDQSAVQRLRQLQAQQPSGKQVCLRIEVEGGGCSGYQYKFSLDNNPPTDADRVFEVEGARVVVDNTSYELLKGSKVEFEDTLMRRAFVVGANPNSEASCGCGSSFAVKMPKTERRKKPAQ